MILLPPSDLLVLSVDQTQLEGKEKETCAESMQFSLLGHRAGWNGMENGFGGQMEDILHS